MCEWRFSCKSLADSLYQEAFGEVFYNGIQAPVQPSKNHTMKEKRLALAGFCIIIGAYSISTTGLGNDVFLQTLL